MAHKPAAARLLQAAATNRRGFPGRKKKERKRKLAELSCVSSRLRRAPDLLVMTS